MGPSYPFYLPVRRLIVYRFIHIHLLNLLDGSPLRTPHSDVITWALPPGVLRTDIRDFVITRSRLMMYATLRLLNSPSVWRVVSWDWRTGDSVRVLWLRSRFSHVTFQVLDRSSAGESGLIRR